MRVYLDTSALVKRAVLEPESDALELEIGSWRQEGAALLTSELALIEVSRAVRVRRKAEDPRLLNEFIENAFAGIRCSPMEDPLPGLARRIGSPWLRSLDAIHLATASILDVDLMVAYDARLLEVAEEMGFETVSPR